MQKIFKILLFTLLVVSSLSWGNTLNAQESQTSIGQALPEINFFYSQTCTHCADQKEFHKYLLEKYPDLIINSYDIADSSTSSVLETFIEKHEGSERYRNVVPLTFIGESFIVGFNTPETTGATIELALIKNNPGLLAEAEFCDEEGSELCLISNLSDDPFGSSGGIVDSQSYTIINQTSRLSAFGINAEDLSLPILSIVLGFMDGFNVCSLGALMLILSLVLTFKSRKKVLLFGGLFILITGITYAALIFIWFSVFSVLASVVEIVIGLLGLIGGLFFLRQYFRFKKYGPTCGISDSPTITKVTEKIQKVFSGEKNIWLIGGAVVLFSFVVTVIEFPCSAVIPVAFAAILTDFGVSLGLKSFYLFLFMIFYLLDELIIFIIGVVTLRIWTGGKDMTIKLTLAQAILFMVIGGFYLWRILF